MTTTLILQAPLAVGHDPVSVAFLDRIALYAQRSSAVLSA
jgi:hypothetical protein